MVAFDLGWNKWLTQKYTGRKFAISALSLILYPMHSKVQHRTMCLTLQTLEAQGSVVMRIHVLFGNDRWQTAISSPGGVVVGFCTLTPHITHSNGAMWFNWAWSLHYCRVNSRMSVVKYKQRYNERTASMEQLLRDYVRKTGNCCWNDAHLTRMHYSLQ